MKEKYRHYKGGEYEVITEATHTETGEKLVVYKDQIGRVWTRPIEMFYGYVDIYDEDGRLIKTVKRFIKL